MSSQNSGLFTFLILLIMVVFWITSAYDEGKKAGAKEMVESICKEKKFVCKEDVEVEVTLPYGFVP